LATGVAPPKGAGTDLTRGTGLIGLTDRAEALGRSAVPAEPSWRGQGFWLIVARDERPDVALVATER